MASLAMADADLQIRREAGHPHPKIKGGPGIKQIFWPFGPQFGLKIRGRPGHPGPPLSR